MCGGDASCHPVLWRPRALDEIPSFPSEWSARFVFGKKTNDALGRSAMTFDAWL